MRKKISALVLALALVLSCLTGCSSASAESFYDLAEEMAAVQDAQIDLAMPYCGATLRISGFICRSSQAADLTFSLEDTGDSDGIWTELRINGNQIWYNAGQVAERTLAFELPTVRQEDILDLESYLNANWISYTWRGDFWSGIPEWSTLLGEVWEAIKSDLNSHITGSDDSYTLKLSGNKLEQAQSNLLTELTERTDSFRSNFVTWTEDDSELIRSTQWESGELFDNYWQILSEQLEELESGTDTADSLTLTLSKSESSYEVTWVVDESESGSLTVTPTEAQSVESPAETMEFGAYADYSFYLMSFSNTYISDVLNGTELDTELEESVDEDEVELQAMETGVIADYTDLVTIQFVPTDGQARTVPVLANYQSNSLSSEDGNGGLITDLSLAGQGWYQYVYSEAADGRNISQFLEESILAYYSGYVELSGYLLVQDLTEQVSSDRGAMAQGFSYRINDYGDPIVQALIVLPREGNESYTVLDLELYLSEMSQTDKDAVERLFDYLGLELLLDLDA